MSSFNGSDALNNYLASHDSYQDFLEHHGIKGMKWGIRRFQNADGSYTEAGKKRYSSRAAKAARKAVTDIDVSEYERNEATFEKADKGYDNYAHALQNHVLSNDQQMLEDLRNWDGDGTEWWDHMMTSKTVTDSDRATSDKMFQEWNEAHKTYEKTYNKIMDRLTSRMLDNISKADFDGDKVSAGNDRDLNNILRKAAETEVRNRIAKKEKNGYVGPLSDKLFSDKEQKTKSAVDNAVFYAFGKYNDWQASRKRHAGAEKAYKNMIANAKKTGDDYAIKDSKLYAKYDRKTSRLQEKATYARLYGKAEKGDKIEARKNAVSEEMKRKRKQLAEKYGR